MATKLTSSASSTRASRASSRTRRWLRRAIGKRPSIQSERAVLARRRAALAIDDYRREYGHGLGNDPLGERPAGREAARAFDLASSAIDQAVRARTRRRGRGVER